MIENYISKTVNRELCPVLFKIRNDSALHKFKNRNNSHYRLLIVSNKFSNKSVLNRHKIVFRVLTWQFLLKIHSISLFTYTEKEWKIKKNSSRFFYSSICFSKK